MRTSPSPRAALIAKGLEYVGLALFTVAVPRLMGPEDFGTFAAVLAGVGLFTMMTGLGANTTFGRFVPEFVENGDPDAIGRLYTQLLAVRVAMVIPLGVGLALGLRILLPDLPRESSILGSLAFMAGAVGMTAYQLMYGLNRLGRSLLRGSLSRLLIALGILAFRAELSPVVAVRILCGVEVVLCLLGLALAAEYVRPGALRSGVGEVREALRFGAVFFAATLLLTAVWRGGELAVTALASAREEIAFYSIASVIVMALSSLLSQVSTLMLPTVTRMHLRGEDERFERWMAASLRYVTLMAVAIVIGIFALGDRVLPVLLGDGFDRVDLNLQILALGLIPLAVVRTATTAAVVRGWAAQAVLMGAEGLLAFLVLAVVLVGSMGSIGASIAVSMAFVVAGTRAVFRMDLAPVLRRSLYLRTIGPAVLVFSFAIPGPDPILIGVFAMTAYAASVVALGALSPGELREAVRRLT
jgi:O-antigen/teichoic acid export membrane protein